MIIRFVDPVYEHFCPYMVHCSIGTLTTSSKELDRISFSRPALQHWTLRQLQGRCSEVRFGIAGFDFSGISGALCMQPSMGWMVRLMRLQGDFRVAVARFSGVTGFDWVVSRPHVHFHPSLDFMALDRVDQEAERDRVFAELSRRFHFLP